MDRHLVVDAEEDGGVVDEHVDAPEAVGDRPAEALGVVLARHVDALEEVPEVTRHGRALLGVDVRDHHAGTLLGEAPGVGLTDPLPRAGDDRDLVLEPHASPPVNEMAVSTARRRARASRPGRRSGPQRTEARDRARQHCLVALRLDGGAEELDVVPAVVAGIRERPAEAAERDVAVADDDTLAGTHGAHLEVAHLHDGDASRAPADVLVEAALDPGIVQLEDDAEPGRGEGVGEVERLVEGVEEAEVHAQLAHRLEREADTRPLRLRQEGLDARTGTARRLLPGERARRSGQHEEGARAQLGRGREVHAGTLERAALARRVAEREQARRGEARDGKAGLADESRGACHPDRLELPDGHADPGCARGRERLDVPLEGPAEGRDLAHREAHHRGAIPAGGRERQAGRTPTLTSTSRRRLRHWFEPGRHAIFFRVMADDFLDVRSHGFARVAVCVPEVRVADPAFNAEAHLRLLEQVHRDGAHYALCPELGLSAYSCADLFFQETLLAAALAALGRVAEATAEWNLIVSVGMRLV